jgi:lipopolysaccharide export system permease protein
MTIFKYIAKEVFQIFGITSAILLLLVLSNQFARYLGLAASGKLLGFQLIHLIVLEIPQLLSLIFPMAIYLSILIAYSRLYADNEMIVLNASGFSQKQLFKMTLSFALVVAIPVLMFTAWLNPIVANDRDKLLAEISATSILKTLQPGRFQQTSGGNQIFYIEKISNDRRSLNNIFIAQRKENNSWTVMHANSGYYSLDPKTKDHFAVAQNGLRYEGVPGENNFTIFQFGEYGIRLNTPVSYVRNTEIDSVSTPELFKKQNDVSKKLNYNAELEWRLSLPLSVLVLSFLASSLSYVSPRGGRFSKLFPAILIYIIYANFLIAGQDWISNGQLPAWIGLWMMHLLMIVLGICLYAHRENLFKKYWIVLWKS